MRLALLQFNPTVGDLAGNAARLAEHIATARDRWQADLVVFPELALCGYPPEDLLLRRGFLDAAERTLRELAGAATGIAAVVGVPWRESGALYNSAAWLADGEIKSLYHKHCLPNYAVFDERRYFTAGHAPLVMRCADLRVGVIICEDGWFASPAKLARGAGAELLVAPNASPYARGKYAERLEVMQKRALENGIPVAYCNQVGGQDELVFDGRSLLLAEDGRVAHRAAHCREDWVIAEYATGGGWQVLAPEAPAATGGEMDEAEEVEAVLALALRDYLGKNGFSDVVIGLSGGIDSALTAALAVKALGAGHVHGVFMPMAATSKLSAELTAELTGRLGIVCEMVPLAASIDTVRGALHPVLGELDDSVTAQNLQARLRGMVLMAWSNARGSLLMATGNKSELATGYCTLYGDMCGGFAPLKDLLKTAVYRQAAHLNRTSPLIPRGIIDRPPTAELAPGQLDEKSLLPYARLDPILERYVEQDQSLAEVIAAGFTEAEVRKVARLVAVNEYKRRQAPPGPRISSRAFGRDRRYPITSGWRPDLDRPD